MFTESGVKLADIINSTGLESYIYEGDHGAGQMRGHIWDYGPSCKKMEFSINDKTAVQGTFYLGCHAVDCCYTTIGGHGGSIPARPDVKQWDIEKSGWFSKTKYTGSHDIHDLYNDVPDAETWYSHEQPFVVCVCWWW